MTWCHQDPDQGSIKCVTSVRVGCRHEEMLHVAGDGYKKGTAAAVGVQSSQIGSSVQLRSKRLIST